MYESVPPSFADDREICRAAGITGYIAKPVSVQGIEKVLSSIAAR